MNSLYPQKRRFHFLAILIFIAAITLAVAGIIASIAVRESRVFLNAETLCPEKGPNSRTILLLDISDPLSLRQNAALNQLLEDLQNPLTSKSKMTQAGLPGGVRYIEPMEELVAYVLPVSATNPKVPLKPILRVCNPGNPGDITARDELTVSKRRATARWARFGESIRTAFENQPTAGEKRRSPILEAVSLVILQEADSTALQASGEGVAVRLIIFSDMLQNSSIVSHFGDLQRWSVLKKDPQFANLVANLRGVEVVIFYLRRPKYAGFQTTQHYSWWREAISLMGGRLIFIEPL